MFREGRQFEKNTRSCARIRLFVNRFFNENPPKIDQKIKKGGICRKNRQKNIPGSTLFRQKNDFQWFWGAQGDPKIAKNPRSLPCKMVMGAIW